MVKIDRPNSNNLNNKITSLVSELLASSVVTHITHLSVTGPSSYAAHIALNEFYDGITGLADSLAEQYQGIIEKPLPYKPIMIRVITNVSDVVNYLKELYKQVCDAHMDCSHSEISNILDEIKSLIDSTKYKLVLLK